MIPYWVRNLGVVIFCASQLTAVTHLIGYLKFHDNSVAQMLKVNFEPFGIPVYEPGLAQGIRDLFKQYDHEFTPAEKIIIQRILNEKLDQSIKESPILFADQLRSGHEFKIIIDTDRNRVQFFTVYDVEMAHR